MFWQRIEGRGRRHAMSLVLAAGLLVVGAGRATAAPPFPADRAHAILVEFCDLGPRVPGTAAHGAALDYLRDHFDALQVELEIQPFNAQLPLTGAEVELYNAVARFAPERRPRVLLAAHWDSRPWADEDPDSTRRREPVLGANDSASGCAVLLTLGEMLAAWPPAVGVDLVFFDGEDAGIPDSLRSYCLGSQEYARRLVDRPAYGIVLDMVGDRDLTLRPEAHALRGAPAIQRYVWDRARQLAMPAFVDGPVVQVFDDHVPLIEIGVPTIDIIDFDYEFWHTVEDTPEKCSAESLGMVGELITSLVYEP